MQGKGVVSIEIERGEEKQEERGETERRHWSGVLLVANRMRRCVDREEEYSKMVFWSMKE